MQKILISGATGLIGKHLVNEFTKRGDEIIVLTQKVFYSQKLFPNLRAIHWDDYLSLSTEKFDAIINLAGTNLGAKRWNDKFKKEIYDSRIQSTKKIVDMISKMEQKPKVLINSSGVDYYGNTGDKELNEDSPAGDGFIAKLVCHWESEAFRAKNYGVRIVCLRTGFVIAKESKAFAKMIMPYKFFLGGAIGNGEQYLSWIDIDDLTAIYSFCLDNIIEGPVNASSPNPVRNKEFSKIIGKILHRPSSFRVPAFVLKIIAGETASLILNGRRTLPKKLFDKGFRFRYENVYDSLNKNILY